MKSRIMQTWWLVLLLIPTLARAVDVQATLDRGSAQLGDTVTLNLRISGAGGATVAAPDLSVLNRDFDILGTSQNNSLSVVNGVASSTVTYGVALRPKHLGALQIPALSVAGSQTVPLQLQVTAPDPASAAAAHQNVFMEAKVEPDHGYIGQQLNYVVRLFYALRLTDGSLQLPRIRGAEVSQVGDDIKYDSERDGHPYHVIERRYAVIPQQAGSLDIPASGFQGDAVDPNDPDSFFGTGTPISASAPALSVNVLAAPADWGKSAWLPARQLSLTLDGWPSASEPLRVGQPLNLTMTLQATGLSQEALPALSLPRLDGATVYPDKPVTGTRSDGQWLIGKRQQSFAIVPARAGTLTIPATTLKWWNVLTHRMEVAQIPARSQTVLPALGSSATALPGAPAALATGGSAPVAGSLAQQATPWRWIALASVGLWLLSVLLWLRWRRRRPLASDAPVERGSTPRQCQQAFIAAARGNDRAAQSRSLLAWARAERRTVRHLGELAQALADERQRAAIHTLLQQQYASAPASSPDGARLAKAFKPGFRWRVGGAGDKHDELGDLPPLYPFKLH